MKKKKSLYFLMFSPILVMFVALWVAIGKNKEPKDFAQIEKAGVLKVVTDYSPVGYYVSGDTIAGFNYELLRLLKSRIPLRVEVLLESSLDKSIEGLQSGKYDVLVRNIPITSELRESLRFTEPVTENRQVLVQRKKEFNDGVEPLRSHLALAKKTLYVPLNSPAILRINNLSHEIGDTIYIEEDKLYGAEQLVMMVAAKDIDFAVCDEMIAARVARSLPEIDYTTLIGFTHLEAWAVSDKSPVLLDSMNVWIKQVKNTKQYKSLYDKYYK
ncbi:transporter substrate-binding domain-containing protein [Dysgonomonas sp. 511]|uniref:transporter substrate-binding domain-containing protein n=1 Tax=Dysgonomonas sp. 511 TaxID=2302930 RepID=UPI0013D1FA68|nr:transporter substrate-binding domain-containing protein [Dysgonomonas sp. 511]NDV79117.1 glutamine ABC transporter substrate-binding protein [Dysgonomonas sp. 511]